MKLPAAQETSKAEADWQLLNRHKLCIHKKTNFSPRQTLHTLIQKTVFLTCRTKSNVTNHCTNKDLDVQKETLGPCQSWHHTSVRTYDASLNCPPSINTLLSSGQTCLNLAEYWQDDIVNDLNAEKPLPFAWPFFFLLHVEWTVICNLQLPLPDTDLCTFFRRSK